MPKVKKFKLILIWVAALSVFLVFVKTSLLSQADECNRLHKNAVAEIEKLRSCASDIDCTYAILNCPFDCFTAINKEYSEKAYTFLNQYNKHCMMVCPKCPKQANKRAQCIKEKCA